MPMLFEQTDGQRGTIATRAVHYNFASSWHLVELMLQVLQGDMKASSNILGVPFLWGTHIEEQRGDRRGKRSSQSQWTQMLSAASEFQTRREGVDAHGHIASNMVKANASQTQRGLVLTTRLSHDDHRVLT